MMQEVFLQKISPNPDWPKQTQIKKKTLLASDWCTNY